MSLSRVVPSLLAYTLLKKEDGTPLLVFLLWRDRRSTTVESSAYWGPIVCPLAKEDSTPLDAVTRAFSVKTKGIFAPATMIYDDEHQLEAVEKKTPAKQRIEESRIFMRKKLIAANGVTILTCKPYIMYVAPVRFIDTATLNATFGMDKGECEWISAQDLFSAIYSTMPNNAVMVRGHSYHTITSKSSTPVALPLALPFTVTLRTPEARSELAAILKQFNVDVDATIMPPAEAEVEAEPSAAAAAAMPNIAGLSLGSAAAASSSSSAPTAAAAAAPAATSNYSCKKCRKVLFTDLDLHSHTPPANGGGKFAHKHIKVSEGGRRVGIECSSYFIENVDALGSFPPGDGPLLCGKCSTRYGNYIWSGTQCSCGEWIAPAFQVVKSKVDERPTAGPSKTAHVAFSFQRPPPRLASTTATAPATSATAATDPAAAPAAAAPTSQA